ncbi:MAG TPA: hypothetical protein VFV23_05300 [Verrucomicrobiae bacterium]|nr:hypothetical protein [Verrucomicrobiae bacterium]
MSWLPLSCSKNTQKAAATPVSADPNAKNIGEVTLTNHYETCIDIGDGKNCLITPRVLDRKSVQLTMSLQSTNADGMTDALSVMRVVAQPGKPFEVAIGDLDLTLTPKIAE